MRLPTLRRPSASLAVSVMALVVATTGTSYATGLIGSADIRNNSIQSEDIRDGAVRAIDLAPDSVGTGKVRDGSLRARDFFPGVLPDGETRWALVDATGAIIAQSGGFTVTAAYPTLDPAGADVTGMRANGNVYLNTGEDLTGKAIVATVALQNTTDLNGDGVTNGRAPGADSNPEFSGEISAAMCQPDVVNCAPPGTSNTNHLVVSPRNSDGSVTTDGNRKRFYVVVTG